MPPQSVTTCYANMSVYIGKIFPLWEKGGGINFVMPLVHIFLLTGSVSASTVYGGYVLIFVRMKAPSITLKRHKSIYTGVMTVWPANPD
jgi:hypothetical protein